MRPRVVSTSRAFVDGSRLEYNPMLMSRTPGKLVVHHRSRGAAIGSLDGFFLMRCYGELDRDDVLATLIGHEAIVAEYPRGSAAIVVIDPTTAFPSEEARRVMLDATRKTSDKTLAHTLVVLGDGFWASAVRGIMTTIGSLTNSSHPRKVFRHEEEGVDWIIEAAKEPPSKYRPLLFAGLAQLKAGVTVPPPSKPSASKPPITKPPT